MGSPCCLFLSDNINNISISHISINFISVLLDLGYPNVAMVIESAIHRYSNATKPLLWVAMLNHRSNEERKQDRNSV